MDLPACIPQRGAIIKIWLHESVLCITSLRNAKEQRVQFFLRHQFPNISFCTNSQCEYQISISIVKVISTSYQNVNISLIFNISRKYHVEHVLNKISKTVGIISKFRHFVPKHASLNIYKSLIGPYLS